jgi:hypothetical protein
LTGISEILRRSPNSFQPGKHNGAEKTIELGEKPGSAVRHFKFAISK